MKNEFIPYEQALELKYLGFDEECLGHYKTIKGGNMTSFFIEQPPIDESGGVFITKAPLYQQAFRWFREKYDLHYYIEFKISAEGNRYYDVIIVSDSLEETENDIVFNTYEEGQLYCLKELIIIVKNK